MVNRESTDFPQKSIIAWIVDDNRDFCFVLSEALNQSAAVRCPRSFHEAASALDALRNEPFLPDVILLDIEMPGMSGLDAIPRILKLAPKASIIMLTVYDENVNIFKAVSAGAKGYLLKSCSATEVDEAIQDVVRGGMAMDPVVVKKLIEYVILRPGVVDTYDLSEREKDILKLVMLGFTAREISQKLSISFYTVQTHFKKIHEKLDVHSRSEIVTKVLKERIV